MRLRRGLAATALVFSASFVVAGPAPFACAGPGPDATLVVDTGSSEQMLCVALDAESVSGIRLIELASQQHGLSYSLGYGGQAVCMLAGVGSNEEECFEGGQPFWGYWRSNGSGWTWSGTGAGGTVVENGDVEGWSWGTGNDGNSHQQPPFTSHEAVCGPEEQPSGGGGNDDGNDGGGNEDPRKDPRGSNGGQGSKDDPKDDGPSVTSGPSADAPEPDGSTSSEQESKKKRRNYPSKKTKRFKDGSGWSLHTDAAPDPSPTPSSSDSPTAALGSPSESPPIAGLAGLGVAILFGLAGAWFLKRRHIVRD